MSSVTRLYSVKSVAEILDIGTTKVYDLIAAGDLPKYVELGDTRSKMRIRSDDLQRFIDERTIEHGSRAASEIPH